MAVEHPPTTIIAPSPAHPAAPKTWFAAVDGYRGLAVLAVVAFHTELVPGGWLGVDLFLVLSGFLITRILIAEHTSTGRISVGGFWRRRARRLGPALVLALAGVAAVVWWYPQPRALGADLAAEMVAALAYVANWFTLATPGGYWDDYTVASPMRHLWSLSIEEQFYLVFPLVVLGLLTVAGRRHLGVVFGVLAVASWTWAVVLLASGAGFERVYLGTDTRAGAIALGALAGWATTQKRLSAPLFTVARRLALPALAVVVAMMVAVSGPSVADPAGWLALAGFEVCVAVLLVAAVAPVPAGQRAHVVNRALSLPALVGLGAISYGLYLWHVPVLVVLDQLLPTAPVVVVAAATLAVAVAMAWLSYVLVERPVRHHGVAGLWRTGQPAAVPAAQRWTVVAASVGVVAASVGVVWMATGPARVAAADRSGPDQVAIADAPPPGAPTAGEPAPAGRAPAGPTGSGLPVVPIHGGPPRLLLVGDSMAAGLTGPLLEDSARLGVVASATSYVGCVVGGIEALGAADPDSVAGCDQWRAGLGGVVARAVPDVVVVVRAGYRAPGPTTGGEGVCDADYQRWYRHAVAAEVDQLGATGAVVVLATVPYARFARVADAATDEVADCLNAGLAAVSGAGPAELVDLGGWVCADRNSCAWERDGIELRPDGLHLEGPGASLVWEWLIDQLFVAAPAPGPGDGD